MHTYIYRIGNTSRYGVGRGLACGIWKRKKLKISDIATKEAARSIGLMILEAQAGCISKETTAGHPNGCFDIHSIFLKNCDDSFHQAWMDKEGAAEIPKLRLFEISSKVCISLI